MAQFKIDMVASSRGFPFGLYVWRKGRFSGEWIELYRFDKLEDAKAYYEKIKHLPEYLS